jgi:hypothetical protein
MEREMGTPNLAEGSSKQDKKAAKILGEVSIAT